MRDKIVRYARRLESLSITELSQGAEKLVSRERRYTAALIAHLAEISRRKGHLELGFKSLFDYCRIHLGLGKGSVWSRTQLANVSRRFPQVLQHLVEGKASLSSLGVLAAHLSEENVERLLAQAAGKTKEEVKEIVARSKTRLDEASAPKTRLDEAAGAKKREGPRRERHERPRCIPSSVRERLLERADYQCEFRGPTGVRCTARTRLEVDHIVPVGKGGSRGEENLRVFCRGHNLLAAEREFGEEFMRAKIEGQKRRAAVV